MNLNELAKKICALEDGRVNLTIAQVKDVLRAFGDVCLDLTPEELVAVFAKLVR